MTEKNSIGYDEQQANLATRIEAHKKYSNFSLEEWIARNLVIEPGDSLMDLGCGNGNLFPAWDQKLGATGLIVGADKSDELLREAGSTDTRAKRLVMKWNMDEPFPFVDGSFNRIVSCFSIYYVMDVARVLEELSRLLREEGVPALIGPTIQNAVELYDFNEKVFGIGRDETVTRRTSRLENEFHPAMKNVFRDVTIEKIPSRIIFPSKAEFVRYYLATLLFEESVKKTGKKPSPEDLERVELPRPEISKEMVVVRGRK